MGDRARRTWAIRWIVRNFSSVHLVVPPGGSFRETRRIELGPQALTIGRGEGCDVRLDVPGVDGEHAKISEVALIAVGPDCAVGDVPLDQGCRRLVMPGDEIQIGSVVLALDGHDPSLLPPMPDGEAADSPPSSRRPPGLRVRVVEGQNFGDELFLERDGQEYIIGRSPKADLVLDDREVSREHVKIVRRGIAVFIHDQSSTRGSWLGRSAVYQGTTVEWQRPRMLKVGQTVLSLDLPEELRRMVPQAQPSAPMTPPPRTRTAPHKPAVVAVEAPPGVAMAGTPVQVFHYEASPPSAPRPAIPEVALAAASAPSLEQRAMRGSAETRRAWKKTGPVIGKGGGLLLLALAGIAILGALFVVFSLME